MCLARCSYANLARVDYNIRKEAISDGKVVAQLRLNCPANNYRLDDPGKFLPDKAESYAENLLSEFNDTTFRCNAYKMMIHSQ